MPKSGAKEVTNVRSAVEERPFQGRVSRLQSMWALAQVVCILTRRRKCGYLVMILPLLFLAALRASAVEHPGILDRQDNCSTCHADKSRGKSVHSAMEIPCTVCHVAQTRGDMTTMDLLMPKDRICFACHVKSSETEEHSPPVKGVCVSCHDAHKSTRRMLLLRQVDTRQNRSVVVPIPGGNAKLKPSERP